MVAPTLRASDAIQTARTFPSEVKVGGTEPREFSRAHGWLSSSECDLNQMRVRHVDSVLIVTRSIFRVKERTES